MPWTTLCNLDDLDPGLGKYVEIDGFGLAVYKVLDADGAEQVHVMDNTCPHAGAGMYGGWIDQGCAVCPLHNWAFDLKTGALRGSGSDLPMLQIYESRVFVDAGRKLVQANLPKIGAI